VFANVGERLEPIRTLHSDLAEGLPIDSAFVSPKALEGLPNAVILSGIKGALDNLSTRLQAVASQIAKLLAEADKAIADTKGRWSERRKVIEETYEKLLRELQKSKIDGTEFIRLRQQIEELRPLRDKKEALNRDLTTELAIYSDRLEIISPGRLPNGITPNRMRTGCRAARNQLLKDVMRDYGYLEHMGMGIPRKIIHGMRVHNGTEPGLVEDQEQFILRLFA